MSYSIFRVKGIKTTGDLRGIGKHNDERVSHTNLDIDKTRSSENIELVKCAGSYLKKFNEITSEMKVEHEERMKTIRSDRRRTFDQAINSAKNDVAAEFLFTSDDVFFCDKSREEIEAWANKSLEFLEKDIGITKDKIIHAVVHMDEATPHLHVVAVPLTRDYDGRRKAEVLQISRNKFIPTKEDLARLQDIYNERMNERGYNLQRGTTKDIKHVAVSEFKEQTQYHEHKLERVRAQAIEAKNLVEKLMKDVEVVSRVNNIPVHPEIVLERQGFKKVEKATDRVILEPKDYEAIKNLAKASDVLKTQNEQFKADNDRLKVQKQTFQTEIEQLRKENKELKKENDLLKKTMEKVKEFYKEKVPELAITIGYIKAGLLDKAKEKLLKRYFGDENEVKGAQKFVNYKQEQLEKQKQERMRTRSRDRDSGFER
ncbi:MobV family relaxase [Bacillus sp. OTU530]|uniref:MobV family relaxase n=1 Tax=Bacillus sp. OTU530 TaxID=3043862 RepID=UPI00313B1A28